MGRIVVSMASASSMRQQVLFMVAWICFVLFAWYYPRSLVRKDTSILSLPPPYQEASDGTVLLDFELNQPLVNPPTIDDFVLRSAAIWLPLAFFVLHTWFSAPDTAWNQDSTNAANATTTGANAATATTANKPDIGFVQKIYKIATVVSAFAAAIGLSEGCTVMVKLWVKRRRPNFYALCGFDAATKTCLASVKHVREANFSFPSGHSSLTCCGMTFLMWYLHGSLFSSRFRNANHNRFTESSRLLSLVYTVGPLGWALFVGCTRLVDHWHHPSDVLAGLAIGFVTCTIAYHHWYPPIWSSHAGIPRSLLLVMTNHNSIPSNCEDATSPNLETITNAKTKRRYITQQSNEDIP